MACVTVSDATLPVRKGAEARAVSPTGWSANRKLSPLEVQSSRAPMPVPVTVSVSGLVGPL